MLSFLLQGSRRQAVIRAALMIAVVALLDWRVEGNVFFGFLYLFPMLTLGNRLARWQLAFVAAGCTFLAEWLGPGHWQPQPGIPRDIFIFTAYFGTGLFAYESGRNRQLTLQHIREIEQEVELRRDAEQQLKILIESSPAAIVMTDATGKVLMANHAAHELLGFEPEALPGWPINTFLPTLARALKSEPSAPSFRTAMQCYGRRRDGEAFLADVWFSSYQTRSGPRLAAMLVDVTQDLRDREEFSLHQLMAGSRLAVGAVSHEIRNLCSAISVVQANLSRDPELARNEDFQALGSLVEGLGKIATLELRQSAGGDQPTSVDLHAVLDELRIITEVPLREADVLIRFELPANLPRVWADRHNLLQILLNLIKNGQRAIQEAEPKQITIRVAEESERVVVRVCDSGPGVASPERLFQPFQRGAEATGLGLYLSRAFARAFDGDLRYESEPGGWCFALDLTPCRDAQKVAATPETSEHDQDSAGGRSHALSRSAEPLA